MPSDGDSSLFSPDDRNYRYRTEPVKVPLPDNCHPLPANWGRKRPKRSKTTRTLQESLEQCGKTFLKYACLQDREYFFKKIYCGSPACPDCRRSDWKNEDVSVIVRRRVSRIWPKLMWARGFYKLVLSFPPPIQKLFLDRKELTKLFKIAGQFASQITKTNACLISFHPVGNKGLRFHPHFEVLIPFDEASWVDPFAKENRERMDAWVDSLRDLWSQFLLKKYRKALDNKAPKSHIYFSFADKPGYMVQRIRYAVDYHWAVDYENWNDDAQLFLDTMRRVRLVRGFGMLSDRKWKKWVSEKTYYYEDFKDNFDDSSAELKCPLCGSDLWLTSHEIEIGGEKYRSCIFTLDEVPHGLIEVEKSDLLYSPQAWGPLKEAG